MNRILGLGTAVPDKPVSQSDALAMTTQLVCENESQAKLLRALFRNSGVENRYTVLPWEIGYSWKQTSNDLENRGPGTAQRMQLYHELAPPLALNAVQKAIQNSSINPSEITHLVTVSCTGFSTPGVDLSLFESLSLKPTVERTHVGFMGCHGAINGLRIAKSLVSEQPDAVVLLCAVEICSLHYRLYWDLEGIKGNALFADGAAAMVISNAESSSTAGWKIRGTGSCVIPDSQQEMSWKIGDHGFEMHLTRNVPILIEQHIHRWMSAWLDKFGYRIQDIAGWGIHPGGPKILDSTQSALGLKSNACDLSREVLRNYGNMSSPTVLFLLERLSHSVNGPVVLLGFGPGLTAEAALIEPVI